ncbi:MAG: leucyl aminopeptidase, partial [Butyrivibrio sp.]|nr:leucyl aminopeptidase [Butyrivibrio sp.]
MDFEQRELIDDRYELAMDRLLEIKKENFENKNFEEYFHFVADFIIMMDETLKWASSDQIMTDSLEDLQKRNHRLYEDILPENYDNSFANPAYAVAKLGDEFGKLLSSVYYEVRSLIPSAFEGLKYEMLIRMELFLEIYGAFKAANDDMSKLPKYEEIRQIYYWFFSDYVEEERMLRFSQMVLT